MMRGCFLNRDVGVFIESFYGGVTKPGVGVFSKSWCGVVYYVVVWGCLLSRGVGYFLSRGVRGGVTRSEG